MAENIVSSNGITLCYEAFGNKNNPAVLLIMGNSAQGIMWPNEFCEALAMQNRYVIRFDNRDTGLSSCIDFAMNPYNLMDLASDALSILDMLEIQRAHIVGLSMGGSIAQLLAMHHQDRVLSITTMMSSPDLSIKNDAFAGKDTSSAKLPPPKQEFVNAAIALNKTVPITKLDKINQLVENWHLANGDKASFDKSYWFRLNEKALQRQELNPDAKSLKFANHGNHSKAQMATSEPSLKTLPLIRVPTLVIHGVEDPIFPPAHAEKMAELIPDAKLLIIKQMGHALNPIFFNKITQAIIDHTTTG
jgi:pimeloyl-ACP methyl ester carboxylesterase